MSRDDIPRSVLFVQGSDEEGVAAAKESTADAVILDLEHADEAFGEEPAGMRVKDALADRHESAPPFGVRIHGFDTPQGVVDLNAIRSAETHPEFVVVPNVSEPGELTLTEKLIAETDIGIFVLIESPSGVFEAQSIASATPRVQAAAFGPGDFASYMGIPEDVKGDFYVPRYLVSMAANSAGVTAVDVPVFDGSDDNESLRREAEQARPMGYDAKIAVNESQVRVINDVFDVD